MVHTICAQLEEKDSVCAYCYESFGGDTHHCYHSGILNVLACRLFTTEKHIYVSCIKFISIANMCPDSH